ncbi:hypothetical protein [Actinomadura harenae]|uniref:Uncharacterized protein n=1 Tax=Actinomadura harenae TaxID=2483351 RepID=A0A3M2LQ29_9ACTN|nr:hypothetical protein [Actinomadura harenae]RMI39517.1 hypothetical protein EBO15_29600 [Actinomadura harenae]
MNESLESHLRDELRALADAPLPASGHVDIATARTRGTRTRRTRRARAAAAVTAACVAIAGVSYSVLADGGSGTVRRTPPAQNATSGGPGEVRTLTRTASFGWLPDGYREYGVRAAAGSLSLNTTVSAAKPGFTDPQDVAPIQLTTGTRPDPLPRATGNLTVNGKAAAWLGHPRADRSNAIQIVWNYASDRSASLRVSTKVTRDPATVVKIAESAVFARATEPIRFPVRFRGLKEPFEVRELYAETTGSSTPAFGGFLVFGGAFAKQRLQIDVYPAGARRPRLPGQGSGPRNELTETTMGPYKVRLYGNPFPHQPSKVAEFAALLGQASFLPQDRQTTNPFK